MYGYIRPNKDNLRIREYRQFRSAYCGLCESLRRRAGPAARFLVNYDMTFLAMVMSADPRTKKVRCPLHPFRKSLCICGDEALSVAADQSVILAWWKLQDDRNDTRGRKRLRAGFLMFLLRRAYKKALKAQPDFAWNTEKNLRELSRLEREKCASIDRTADCFAKILSFAAETTADERQKRVRRELLYHVGRTVYLLDAVDDFSDDVKEDLYNPLRYRFSPERDKLSDEDRRQIRATLNLSQQNAVAALELRENDGWQSILENILCDGLPNVTDLVFSGEWRKIKKINKGDAR